MMARKLLDVRFCHLVDAIEEGQIDAVQHRADPYACRMIG